MTDVFQINERRTNRLLININWITLFYGYGIFYAEKFFNIVSMPYFSLTVGFTGTAVFCIISEIWYHSGRFKEAGLKYYLIVEIVSGLFVIMLLSKNPYLLGIYFYPIIAAVLYYSNRLILISVFLNILSIMLLILNNLISISSPPTTSKVIFLADTVCSLAICIFLLVGYSNTTKNIIRTIRRQEENLIELNQSLETRVEKRTKELQEAIEELNAKQQELVDVNQSLGESNKELELAYSYLSKTQTRLIQQEKMASLGTLVAGIVHEINNPIGAVICNIDLYKTLVSYMKNHPLVAKESMLMDWVQKIEDTNRTNVIACTRIVDIVKSLKNFAHLDEANYQQADIHIGIENTLVLIRHRIKDGIDIVKQFGNIPKIWCYPSQLNQVFMNLIINASDAIKGTGTIYISTFADEVNIYISIKDTGEGIKNENLSKIFDPGFTTKGAGVGTGLGLSISYSIIENHNGAIHIDTEQGRGTEFLLQLPINQKKN